MAPVRELFDVMPLMINRQNIFISGASWVHAKSKFPSLTFEHFWWAKVGAYNRKDQEACSFWWNADLTNR